MKVTVIADRESFEAALKKASAIGRDQEIRGLASVPDATARGRLEEAWSSVEAALREGYRHGQEKAQELLELAVQRVESLLEKANRKSRVFYETVLSERIQSFLETLVEGMLTRVPNEVQVGSATYRLTKLRFSQKVVVTGSLKLSLKEILALASGGEMVIDGEYSSD